MSSSTFKVLSFLLVLSQCTGELKAWNEAYLLCCFGDQDGVVTQSLLWHVGYHVLDY